MPANTRQWTQVVPSGVELGPARVAEDLEGEDVCQQPGWFLPIHSRKLALVTRYADEGGVTEGSSHLRKLPDAGRFPFVHSSQVFRVFENCADNETFRSCQLGPPDRSDGEVDEFVPRVGPPLLVRFLRRKAPGLGPVSARLWTVIVYPIGPAPASAWRGQDYDVEFAVFDSGQPGLLRLLVEEVVLVAPTRTSISKMMGP